jgi:hypothetical protein
MILYSPEMIKEMLEARVQRKPKAIVPFSKGGFSSSGGTNATLLKYYDDFSGTYPSMIFGDLDICLRSGSLDTFLEVYSYADVYNASSVFTGFQVVQIAVVENAAAGIHTFTDCLIGSVFLSATALPTWAFDFRGYLITF